MRQFFLILFISVVLISNSLFNHRIIDENSQIFQVNGILNQILTNLDDLNHLIIEMDSEKQNYLSERANESLKGKLLVLKNSELQLVKKVYELCEQLTIPEFSLKSELSSLEGFQRDFHRFFDADQAGSEPDKGEEPLVSLDSGIGVIEKKLEQERKKLFLKQKSNLTTIYYTDTLQTVLIIIITLIIIRILNNENRCQQKLMFELQQTNNTKDRFFSIISHDLKNSFNVILGFSDLMCRNLSDETDEKPERQIGNERTRKFAAIIFQNAKKTHQLLENLLEWSRLQTGKIVPVFNKIFVRELVEDVFELMRSPAEQKSIQMSYESSGDHAVWCDRNMLHLILRNLISNAIKFTHSDGHILVAAKADSKYILISVIDNGVGIDDEILGKLFDMEVKCSAPGTLGEKGTGLGLLLCRELAEAQRGTITVESSTEMGTQFTVALPEA
ncbi:MAG: hypothetical protein CVV64_16460 [Candidatus Wallbacteria bacterium HGW-Wallbacteria-1]|jgi:signal transduction histidine kinase|uniref:histidine kinase n=1 Tax=Candidatus Wallbacteria bacterium HGW-Wallbacteria-1 TaxID=2013854 RepID=A0A2N1PL03_9BACT|nr:MAG: hypothetical protein CVV64_16460 [Candidatus Wallbacteria bacterium HGW-Wallbacteria-1]